ncbi:MAG: PLP-dependent transferase, partial [bacterium]
MTGDPSSPEHRSVPETPSTEASRVELATRAVHDVSGTSSGDGAGDLPERRPGAPVAPPLVLSSTFHSGGPDDGGRVLYGREGGNPTLQRVGRRVASLEGMEEGLVVGSGMAAISVTCLSLLRAGDHLVASRYLYGT